MSTTKPSEDHDLVFKNKKEAREKIIQEWLCAKHSLPDKPAACWHDKNCLGLCFPLTMSNINFWVSLYCKFPLLSQIDSILMFTLCRFHILMYTQKVKNYHSSILSPVVQDLGNSTLTHINPLHLCPCPFHAIKLPMYISLSNHGLQTFTQYLNFTICQSPPRLCWLPPK